jgi:hypothetical protein
MRFQPMSRSRRPLIVGILLALVLPVLALVGLVLVGLVFRRARTVHHHVLCSFDPVRWRGRCERAWQHGWSGDAERVFIGYRKQEMTRRTTPAAYWKSGEPRFDRWALGALATAAPGGASMPVLRTLRDGDVSDWHGRALPLSNVMEAFGALCERGDDAACAEGVATRAERTGERLSAAQVGSHYVRACDGGSDALAALGFALAAL